MALLSTPFFLDRNAFSNTPQTVVSRKEGAGTRTGGIPPIFTV